MTNYKLPLFLIVLFGLSFSTIPCRAEVVSSPKKTKMAKDGKTFSNPSEAAAAGYRVGQTVMVKDDIIYKLNQDPKTGRYFYKRYRAVKKKTADTLKRITPSPKNKTFFTPAEAAAVGYKVGQTVMTKKGVRYKLAQDTKTGEYTYKRYRVIKSKKTGPLKTVPADAAVTVHTEPDVKGTTVVTPKAKAESDLNGKTEVQQDTTGKSTEKASAEVMPEAKEIEQAQITKEQLQNASESRRSKGRNMNRLAAAISFRHAFLDRETVLTGGSQTSAGENISIATGGGYSTDMHSDILRLRMGLTNAFEVFLDAGFAYDKLSDISDMEPAFGGGFRANLATVETGFFSGGYLAFSGEYLQGQLSTSDSSSDGTVKSTTEIDWQDMTATVESGIVFSKITLFTGCSYMLYSEEIATKQTDSSATTTTLLEEELEQENSLNFSCGVEYHYSPSLNLQFEIQAPSRLGGIVSAEYRF